MSALPSDEPRGTVYLVGAGPGDPELITLKGLRCLRQADVVVFDRLVAPELVDEAPSWAERVFVGKEEGRHTLPQEEIQEFLLREARAGRQVVRLKGGDPFVFGRGGEEALACAEAGIAFEVIPGVSSAVAAPASAGIPVTQRGVASSFAVVTAHRSSCAEAEGPDWASLAAVETLVILMGVRRLPEVTRALLAAGRSPHTPAAVVERGTQPDQRSVIGTLATIAARCEAEGICSPATIVVGEVVRMQERLHPFLAEGLRMVAPEADAQAADAREAVARDASRSCPAPAPTPMPEPAAR